MCFSFVDYGTQNIAQTFQYNYIAIQPPFYILLCECKGKGMTANKV